MTSKVALAAPPQADADVEITASTDPANPGGVEGPAPNDAPPQKTAERPTTAVNGASQAPATSNVQASSTSISPTAPSASAESGAKATLGEAKAGNPPAMQGSANAGISPLEPARTYDLSGYVQTQYEFHQDSTDQLRQGGALLNQNRFLVRRARVRYAHDWDYASVVFELDGNTSKGAAARIQKGEASLVYGRSTVKGRPPLLQLAAGMFDLPFGFEMTDSAKTRWFMERSIVSRALFPGEPDVGVRLSGAASFLRYSVAVTNGEPLDEKSGFGLQDPNANKDVTVRMGADVPVGSAVGLSGGVSYHAGKGFHAGTDATKGTLTAVDANGDGVPESFLLSAGQAATLSQNFSRWAMGADFQLKLNTKLGRTQLYGEVVAAQNLDRGLVIADPTTGNSPNVREFGGYIGLTQEITRYAVVGVRGDYYDPNADFLETRAGKQLPTDLRILGLSPMAGFVLPERARLLVQWDIQDNKFARDERGVPTRLKNNAVILRLQVNL